ncbi:MAG: tRNA (adenosine(37)-N6)-threonylcarbamoyltransferase complex dimerization subunit type 1 TsaB [Gammaproteobacteria bacterium]|nr:tRNA (adenosine(37)-N6)-threonylcarbamoyltransferase complex dimerization subunit type 1 TsaB [Gammaproteobacteria bacterium]
MRLLAIDTSSLACSAAVRDGAAVYERHEEQERAHTRLLTPMIRSLLHDAELEIADLDAIVLGNGPGSFIGMRIAASVAQGLAFGAGLRIVPVSSLAAVAAQVFAETDAHEVVVTQDAHMSEVYLGAYRRSAADLPAPLFAERLHGQQLIEEIDAANMAGRIAAGFGWRRYPELLALNESLFGSCSEILYPRAVHLLSLGALALENGETIDPQDLVPAYLRNKVAEKPGERAS